MPAGERMRAGAVLLLAAVLAVSGCARAGEDATQSPSSVSPTVFPNWPPLAAGMRFHWSAESGIDLLTGPAVPIRAYLESYLLVGLLADFDAGYPGFKRAVPYPPSDAVPPNNPAPRGDMVYSAIGDYRHKPLYGTLYLHLMRITATPNGFSSLVCDSRDGLYIVDPEGKYRPRFNSVDIGPEVRRVDITDRLTEGGPRPPVSPDAPQRGPLPAPAEDVFGPWVVTGSNVLPSWFTPDGRYAESSTSEWEALKRQCVKDIQTPGLHLPAPVLEAPPEAAAVPGWPAPPS